MEAALRNIVYLITLPLAGLGLLVAAPQAIISLLVNPIDALFWISLVAAGVIGLTGLLRSHGHGFQGYPAWFDNTIAYLVVGILLSCAISATLFWTGLEAYPYQLEKSLFFLFLGLAFGALALVGYTRMVRVADVAEQPIVSLESVSLSLFLATGIPAAGLTGLLAS